MIHDDAPCDHCDAHVDDDRCDDARPLWRRWWSLPLAAIAVSVLLFALDARAADPESYRLRCVYPSGEVRCSYGCRLRYAEEFVAECKQRGGKIRRIER